MALALVLDQSPLDSPFFALDGDGTLALPGRDILVELDAWDIAGSTLTTFYFGSRAYNDPSAPDYYAPRLEQPLNFRRDIYSAQTTGGAGRQSFGEMRLNNNDGGLDFLRDYGLAGQRVRMLIGDIREDYSTFEPLIVGRVQQVFFNNTNLTIQLRDRLQDLAVPVPVSKFAGNNVLPDGLEGAAADDLKDKYKPKVVGYAINFSLPCVNTSRLIYQVNDGVIEFLDGFSTFDGGAVLTFTRLYVDQADMEANAPAAGCYNIWAEGGYIRLGAEPTSTVTASAADLVAAADRTAAQVAVRIVTLTPLAGEGGVDAADINFDDVDALDIAAPAPVGVRWDAGETYAQILDQVLVSQGIWYGFDRSGMFRMQQLALPELPYVVTFRQASIDSKMAVGDYNILAYRFVPNNDPERGMPSKKISVDYQRNYTVQPASALAGIVSVARRNFLALAYRTEVTPDDPTIEAAYPLAVEKKVATLLTNQADAVTEAARLLEIFREPRDFLEIDTVLQSDLIGLVDIGSVVNVVLPRFDYASGKVMRVIGMAYNAQAGILTLTVWG